MNSKIIRLVVSFLAAFALWFIVVSLEYTQTEHTFKNVTVRFEGQSVLNERGLRITSDTDLTVDLTITGNRSALNRLQGSDISVTVDLTRIYEEGEKSLPYEVDYPSGIQVSSLEVMERSPAEIKLTVEQWITKGVDVKLVIRNTESMPQGFEVDEAQAGLWYDDEPIKQISVSGPKKLVDQIQLAQIVVDMSGRTESVDERIMVELCDADGDPLQGDLSDVAPTPYKLLAKVPVLMVKQIPLKSDLINVNQMPADYVMDPSGVRIESDGVAVDTILVSGPKQVVEQIAMAKVTVDMMDKTETVTLSKKVTLCNEEGNPILGDLSEVVMNPGVVDITVPVQQAVGEKNISILMPDPLRGGGLTAEDVQITLEYDSVMVYGAPSALAELETLTLPVIKLGEEADSFVDRVYIVALPAGVQTQDGANEIRVKVSLTIPPMETKMLEIPINQIERLNLPSGVLANIYGSKLEVWVRGRGNILSQIRAADIAVSVNLAGAQQDGYYPLIITVKKYENVGVIPNPDDENHTYQIYVRIISSTDILPVA
ncbi:MAG: hypothetical protein IJV82_03860 [Oscillospiraceae bacterium]|nr:hypothetical protein [Oscillospiraceae bacterium]